MLSTAFTETITARVETFLTSMDFKTRLFQSHQNQEEILHKKRQRFPPESNHL